MKRFCFGLLLCCCVVAEAAVPARPLPPEVKKPQRRDGPIRVLVPKIDREEKNAIERLKALKFEVVHQPWDKIDPDKLTDIDVIFLPTHWGEDTPAFRYFEEIQDAFQRFVKRGGGLLASQPNPGNFVTPKLLPYPITFQNGYDKNDPTRVNLAPNHFITEDLPPDSMPFPFDPMIEVDPRYTVLAKQKNPDAPSLAVCAFGDGRIVVQTANEGAGAIIPLGDEVLRRMVVWAAGRDKK